MQAKGAADRGQEGLDGVGCELEAGSGAGGRVELDHRVVETAGGVHDGDGPVAQAVELVEATRLEA